jgi:lipopolysaccharide export system protein LptA
LLLAFLGLPCVGQETGGKQIEVQAERLEYDAANGTFVASAGEGKKVEVKAEGLLVTCGTLSLSLQKGGTELRQLDAGGGVEMKGSQGSAPNQEVHCTAQSLTYVPASGTVTASGDVRAQMSPVPATGGVESVWGDKVVLQRGGAASAEGKAGARVVRPGAAQGQEAVAVVKGHELQYRTEGEDIEARGGPSAPWAEIEYDDAATGRTLKTQSRSAVLAGRGEEHVSLEGKAQLESSAPSGESLSLRAEKVEYSTSDQQASAQGEVQGVLTTAGGAGKTPVRLSCGADAMIYAEAEQVVTLTGNASAVLEDPSRPGWQQAVQRADEVTVDMAARDAAASGGVEMAFMFPRQGKNPVAFSLKGDSVAFNSKQGILEADGAPDTPVKVQGEDVTLTCVQVKGTVAANGGLEGLSALGGVTFGGKTTTFRIDGKAQEVSYSPGEQTITASGNVSGVLSPLSGQGGERSWENADTAVFHLDSGNVDVSGERVKMSFPAPK